MWVFQFIDAEKTSFPIALMCRRLGVSTAGYYAWRQRPPSARSVADAQLSATIQQIHARSRGTYGGPRIHAELSDEHGVHCGRKRVARLMRIAQLRGVCRRRRVRTTRRDEQALVSDDLGAASVHGQPTRRAVVRRHHLPAHVAGLPIIWRWSSTCGVGGWSGGAWLTTSEPSSYSMPSRWRCGIDSLLLD